MFHGYQRKATEAETHELVHDSYLMRIHNTCCARCGSGERYQELFEVWIHPTKTATTGLKQMRPVMTDQLKDMHIAYIEMPDARIPICSDCISTYKCATDQTPTKACTPEAWADTLKRKYQPQRHEVKIARSAGAGS